MEYCDGGELLDYITEKQRLDDNDPETLFIYRQIVEAIAQCHEVNFVHRYR